MKKLILLSLAMLCFTATFPNPKIQHNENKDFVIIIANTSYYNVLIDELLQYKADVENNFPVNLAFITSTWQDSSAVRDTLKHFYHTENLKGAILLGDIPYVSYEMSWGDIFVNMYYYEDLDGEFIDINNNGKFDHHNFGINSGPEIWLSIIRFNSESDPSDLNRIKEFFHKTHRYYTKKPKYNKALVCVNSDWAMAVDELNEVLKPQYQSIVTYGGPNIKVNSEDYLTDIQSNQYDIIEVWSHASTGYQYFDYGIISGNTILNLNNTGGLLTSIWGCSAANFMNSSWPLNYAYCFGTGIGQASVATARSIGIEKHEIIYEHLFNDQYLGYAYKQWIDLVYSQAFIENRFPNEVDFFLWGHMLTGNPFLYIKPDFTNNTKHRRDLNSSYQIHVTSKNLYINSKVPFTYQLYDINGRLISSTNHKSQDAAINLSSFSSGIYIISVTIDKESFIQKFAVRK